MTVHISAATESASATAGADTQLRELYESQAPGLLRYLIRLTNGDRHRAEDLLQETLLRAWRRPESRTGTGEWRRSWLYTVARNVAIDDLRTTRPVELAGELLDDHPDTDDPVERLLDAGVVHAALDSLPDRLRTVLVEVYLRERSGEETAQLLGVPVGTVKSRTFYALQALRERLAPVAVSHRPSAGSTGPAALR
ncbi:MULTISPECIES: sigma-70 family RNA polymerase sigma factor [unclassified Solwaraspora]|uniref:sigma-70 family RNA polymerase sigma factor n=1 Tax=unclassified Solwaraspora TaxID=2627926 RepID=UPI00259B1B15|nr:sigma-70 family RNA polymerase sigma factor [Solwaraspora sp. WMMA2056]WJK38790.1 sigma-70 family RNA polymerase sigma factor [Solwaraspora sp. WMMA2056]